MLIQPYLSSKNINSIQRASRKHVCHNTNSNVNNFNLPIELNIKSSPKIRKFVRPTRL